MTRILRPTSLHDKMDGEKQKDAGAFAGEVSSEWPKSETQRSG